MKTATEAAKDLECCIATVALIARRMKIGKRHGWSLSLTEADIKLIGKNIQRHRGCKPKKPQKAKVKNGRYRQR